MEPVPELPIMELHGARGRTLALTPRSVRLGGGGTFGSIPIGEVAGFLYEPTRFHAAVWTLVGICGGLTVLSIFLAFLFGDDDFLALTVMFAPPTLVLVVAGMFTKRQTFYVYSRGGTKLGLRPAASERDAVSSFVDAVERAKGEAKGATPPTAPSFERYARQRG